MNGCCFHRKDWTAAVLDELLKYSFSIVVFTVSQSGKGTHTNQIAVAAHDGDGF